MRSLRAIAYGSYAWLSLLVVALPLAVAFLVMPGVLRRRRLARWGARTVLTLIGSPVRVTGQDLEAVRSAVVVANHSSYLDGIILTAALPPRFTFLIKHEMSTVPLVGFMLRRLGSQFVNRDSAQHRHRTVRRLVAAATNGGALAVFPEGTFDAEPGLKRFQLGAFSAARRGDMGVVPLVISGARAKLPAGAALPAPGPLAVHACAPLPAAEFGDARALMRASRAAILDQLGEPDLADSSPRRGRAAG
jgi:1-acyl-sn-glycerol-3-phosphate acyltransferase